MISHQMWIQVLRFFYLYNSTNHRKHCCHIAVPQALGQTLHLPTAIYLLRLSLSSFVLRIRKIHFEFRISILEHF